MFGVDHLEKNMGSSNKKTTEERERAYEEFDTPRTEVTGIRQWVEYFGKVYGKVTVAVPPQYTSQNCSNCGKRVVKALSERTHRCGHCGTVLDRDHNAALNILASGLNRVGHTQIHACGEFDLCQIDASLVSKLSR